MVSLTFTLCIELAILKSSSKSKLIISTTTTTLLLGRYLFIESSWPRQTDEKAVVLSETIPVKGSGKCVRFWYHMYGTDIGTLRVLMRVGYAISESVVWELTGNQGNKWQYGQAPMISGGQNIEVK